MLQDWQDTGAFEVRLHHSLIYPAGAADLAYPVLFLLLISIETLSYAILTLNNICYFPVRGQAREPGSLCGSKK